MRRTLRRPPSPPTIIACIALMVALGGTGYAAIKLPANSVGSKQLKRDAVTTAKVKNGSLLAADLAGGQLPRGPQGPEGPPGAKGDPGAAGGLSDVHETTGNVTLLTGSKDIMLLSLPPGSWLVFAHVGAAHRDSANSARLECSINEPGGSGGDFAKVRLPPNTDAVNSLVFADLTLHAAVSFTGQTTVKTTCGTIPGTDAGFDLTTRKMTAVRVGRITGQAP